MLSFYMMKGDYMKDTKEIKNEMIQIYGNICFLGGTICRDNPLTYHHCIAVRDRGKTTMQNGALLCRVEHDMFNCIEVEQYKKAQMLNDYFQYFKETKDIMLLRQMREYVLSEMIYMGYEIKETGRILVLERKY